MSKLPLKYYLSEDVESIAKSLLGKCVFSNLDGTITGGMITETEAYKGIFDKASHSFDGRRTPRTEVMYHKGGISYVYLCYGIHYLLNVVTAGINVPHAVLIRGIYPIEGIEHVLSRIGKSKLNYNLTNGPGKLTKALGINLASNGKSIGGDEIWIEDNGIVVNEKDIDIGPRIGVDYAGQDALLPYRFELVLKSIHNLIDR